MKGGDQPSNPFCFRVPVLPAFVAGQGPGAILSPPYRIIAALSSAQHTGPSLTNPRPPLFPSPGLLLVSPSPQFPADHWGRLRISKAYHSLFNNVAYYSGASPGLASPVLTLSSTLSSTPVSISLPHICSRGQPCGE